MTPDPVVLVPGRPDPARIVAAIRAASARLALRALCPHGRAAVVCLRCEVSRG